MGNTLTENYDYYAWDEKATVESQLVGQGGRLKNMTVGTLQNLSYLYDAVGNIRTINDSNTSETQTFDYDALDRLTSANVTNGPAPYAETYGYNAATGNQKTRVVGTDNYDLKYDAENRLVEVKKNNSTIAQFTFDGDGRRVKSVIGNETILFVGSHYQITNPGAGQTVSKYYLAGASRIAMRRYAIPQTMSLEYLIGDHLGSTSLTTDANGNKVSEMRYKAWGEVRYSWTDSSLNTTPAYALTKYTFTGQYSNMSDFNLMFYNARWYDPYITQFSQPDSIIPDPYNPQDWNRYAYVRNNPLRYTDPSGHCIDGITTWACIAIIGGIVLKAIDYGWTGYDIVQSGKTLSDPNANGTDKMFAGLNVALAAIFEAGEPDDLLPVGIPLDDVGRKAIMKGAKEAFEAGGEAGLEKFLREQLGDHADEVLDNLGLGKVIDDPDRILQTGGHTMKKQTLDALGLSKDEAHQAWNKFKDYYKLRNDFHGIIKANGDILDPKTRTVIGNLLDFAP